ncbi:MAG: tetratricopeptide repeat protein [Candidatus Thermoplasmatota archaeon]|nr:tetratricopeptide repeat protein [Candidatus Thermoplasmatota archaeon]
MRIVGKEFRVLYAIFEYSREGELDIKKNERELSDHLDVSPSRLRAYLGSLRRKDLISSIGKDLFLTERGLKTAQDMKGSFEKIYVDPIKHSLPGPVTVSHLISGLKRPGERVALLEVLSKNPDADISLFLDICRRGSIEEMKWVTEEKFRALDIIDTSSIYDSIMSRTFYGMRRASYDDRNENPLFIAEVCFEMGKIDKARENYLRVLGSGNESRSERILVSIGLAKIQYQMGDPATAMGMIIDLKDPANNRLQNAYIDMSYASVLMGTKDVEKGRSIMKRCSSIFNRSGHSVLEARCEAFLGVHYFMNDMIAPAKHHLERALNACRDTGCEYMANYVKLNLWDVLLKEGDLDGAERMLSSAEDYFKELSVDLYGIAGCLFNRALLQIEMGMDIEAIVSMDKALNIAYPHPSANLRRIWIAEFNRRSKDKGSPIVFGKDP